MTPQRYMELRALANKLIASCDGGHDYWETLEDLSGEDCAVLDGMALECGACNQWFAAAEMTDAGAEYLCRDCKA